MDDFSERTETLLPEPAQALGGLLGVGVPDLAGEGLPLLWHWVYLLDRPAQAELGPDGHPLRGTTAAFAAGSRRRMWAGGRVRTSGPLRCGEPATKRSRVLSVQEKHGRSGPLTFITVEHQILQRDQAVIDEQQDIVYREAVSPAGQTTTPSQAGEEGKEAPAVPANDCEWVIDVSPTLLFRFSALTYNAHRIHYDRDYARGVEGYPDLVVHGPLQAMLMAEHHRRRYGSRGPVEFGYRLVAPLFLGQGLVVSEEPHPAGPATHDLQVSDATGRTTAKARLRVG